MKSLSTQALFHKLLFAKNYKLESEIIKELRSRGELKYNEHFSKQN